MNVMFLNEKASSNRKKVTNCQKFEEPVTKLGDRDEIWAFDGTFFGWLRYILGAGTFS